MPAGSSSVTSQALPGPHPFSAAPPPGFSFPTQLQASFFPPPTTSSSAALSSSALPVPPPPSFRGSVIVPGLGVVVPSSSGVPPFPSYPSTPSATGASVSTSGWPPAPAFQYDLHAFPTPPPPADLLSDSDDCYPDDDPPLEPLAPPLSLDSGHSEYRRMVEYVWGLFLQVVGVAPPPHALFESFFASAIPAAQSLAFNWFDRVRTTLVDADAHMAGFLASGRSERLFLPQRLSTYAMRGECASGRAVPVNDSL